MCLCKKALIIFLQICQLQLAGLLRKDTLIKLNNDKATKSGGGVQLVSRDKIILRIPMGPIEFPWELESLGLFHWNGNGLMGMGGNKNATFSIPATGS